MRFRVSAGGGHGAAEPRRAGEGGTNPGFACTQGGLPQSINPFPTTSSAGAARTVGGRSLPSLPTTCVRRVQRQRRRRTSARIYSRRYVIQTTMSTPQTA